MHRGDRGGLVLLDEGEARERPGREYRRQPQRHGHAQYKRLGGVDEAVK